MVSDLFGVSGWAIVPRSASVSAIRRVLAALAHGTTRSKTARLSEALTGRFADHHAFLLERILHRVDALTAEIVTVQSRIDARVAALADTVTPLDRHGPVPDQGGWIAPGISTIWKASGRPEPVLTAAEHDGLLRWRSVTRGQLADRAMQQLIGSVHINAENRRAGEIMYELWRRLRVARRGGVYAMSSIATAG